MIAALMVYCLAVTTLLGAAAVAAERVLRLANRPARIVWTVAMLAAVGFSAARFRSGLATREPTTQWRVGEAAFVRVRSDAQHEARANSPVAESAPAAVRATFARVGAARIAVASGSTITKFDRPLIIGWVAISFLALAVIGLSALRLARPQPRWAPTTVDGIPVLLSHDLGPAVIGLFRYRIVLPAWALELAPVERDLILAHEREHAAAGDPSLLLLATVLVALTPWNAPLWWMARRLRFAIELDCDARVLRTRPDPCAYGALLLDVSERTLGGAMPIAALAEPISLIERRIAAMTRRGPRFVLLRTIVAGALAAALVVVACAAPRPASVPAPASVAPGAPGASATQSSAGPIARMEIDSLQRLVNDLRTELRARDSSRRPMSRAVGGRPARDSLVRYTAFVQDDSLLSDLTAATRRLQGILATSGVVRRDTVPVHIYGGTYPRNPSGVVDSSYPRVILDNRTLGASVTRDSASWSRARAATAAAGGSGIGGGVATSGAASVAGSRATSGYEFARMDRRMERVRDIAVKYFPSAFEIHENEHHLIVLVFDSTGALVKMGTSKRPATGRDERLVDRDVLAAVLPGVSINSFYEWGMGNISTTQQKPGSGVMVMYAFTGRAPW